MNPKQPTAATATTATDDQEEEEEEEGGERYSVAAVATKKRHMWNISITVVGIELIRHTSECSRFQGGGGMHVQHALMHGSFHRQLYEFKLIVVRT